MNNDLVKIFIGFDSRQVVAFNVLVNSIYSRASMPVSFTPIILKQLKQVFKREWDPQQSTEFSFSRFLVPYLSNYEGWSLFLDIDMLVLDDISKLWGMRNDKDAVMVIKHDYIPKFEKKDFGQIQTHYDKKNWSSLILFNNPKCKRLSPEYVNAASGLELHQFKWLNDDNLIGELPSQWNYLVGEDINYTSKPSIIHYTNGGPYINDYKNCPYSKEWFDELQLSLLCDDVIVKQL